MTKRAILLYIQENESNIQTFIESRTAQKIYDDGRGTGDNMIDSILNASRDFLSFPDSFRTASEEDLVEAIDDYVIGRFFDQYASSAIAHMKDIDAEIARMG